MTSMQVVMGIVVNGQIVIEGMPLAEGAVVTVVARGPDEGSTLTDEQEDELVAAMAEVERGEFVELEDLLASLPSRA